MSEAAAARAAREQGMSLGQDRCRILPLLDLAQKLLAVASGLPIHNGPTNLHVD